MTRLAHPPSRQEYLGTGLIRLAARRTQPSATVFLFTLGGVPKGLHDHPNQHPKFSSMA